MTELQTLLESGAVAAARGLIGWRLFRKEPDGSLTGGTIIETEAYTQEDAASHSYRGRTPRTELMFEPAGSIYVYFTYGMHWCANIVTGMEGDGEAVLLRAIRPESNSDIIRRRRSNRPLAELTNGPAKVCQALNITGTDAGSKCNEGSLLLLPPIELIPEIQATTRIGITKDVDRPWRFVAVQQ